MALAARSWPARIASLAACVVLAACGGGGGRSAAEPASAPLQQLPVGAPEPEGVRLFPAHAGPAALCIFRTWPSEYIVAYESCDGPSPRRLRFDRGAEGELQLLQVTEAADGLILFTYDARRNIPSGRIPGVVSEGIDLWKVHAGGTRAATEFARIQPLGGFDNLIFAQSTPDGIVACAVRRCLQFGFDGSASEWALGDLANHEIVDLKFSGGAAFAVIRPRDDGLSGMPVAADFHYGHAKLTPAGVEMTALAPECLPFDFRAEAGASSFRCATSPADMAQVLREDLARMPHGGWMEYGSSNAEGRIAWSQAYYLGALMDLAGGRHARLGTRADWATLSDRLRYETMLLARRSSPQGSGYASKRYSVNRQPIVFALHLARIAQVLDAASRTGHDSAEASAARRQLREQLVELPDTVESFSQATHGASTYPALRIRKGVDFWCDGVVAPFNFTSAYVSGLLALDGDTPASRERAAELLRPLLDIELAASPATWRYWWSEGRFGWRDTDALSVNTPAYSGSPNLAHVTYRSMDAVALAMLHARSPGAVPDPLMDHIGSLVRQGSLLPSVNTYLPMSVVLDRPAAMRYARSAAPWEIASQIWALENLASGN